jgi:elongation factor Ts
MSKSDLLKELRIRTQAGMKDCHDALREANDDLEKAVDIIKTKGKNIVSGRENKVASEGLIVAGHIGSDKTIGMIEVNCQTDFVSRSPDFRAYADDSFNMLLNSHLQGKPLDVNSQMAVDLRTDIIAKTKENCVVRRWWVEEVSSDTCKTFLYIHNGGKLGVILSLQAPSAEAAVTPEFAALGLDLAMQVAAMNPLAVSSERLSPDLIERQKGIFETQLQELNKPPATWAKILDGKFTKWYTEVCLLNQESVVVPKTTVNQVVKNAAVKLGGEVQIINFIRAEVGEGLEKKQDNLAEEVAKLI